ncbi:MAG: glucosyltransferase [Lachnospiraceae bacterium]|nr:glucosyltransferase [Lachnospiraceae bacterium]
MSKIAFFCIPAHGHINPTLEVVKELIYQGHEVRYYSYECMREKIESTGAEYFSCDDYDFEQKLTPADGKRIAEDMSFAIEILVSSTLAMDAALLEQIKQWKPDCIVADSMALWGKLIAKKLNIPFVSSTTTFAFNKYSAKVMQGSLKDLFKVLIQMGKAKKHIKRLQENGYDIKNVLEIIQNDNDTDTIVYTSPEFQPYSDTFSDRYVFVGPSIRPTNEVFEKTREKLVYISMGTVNNDMTGFYKNCIDALKDSDYQVVLSVGSQVDIKQLEDYVIKSEGKAQFHVFPYVNQIAVLKKADAFITHCGMNSVSEALYFKVPLVMYPQTNEQKGVAFRVNELEAGLYLSGDSISEIQIILKELLQQAKYKERATVISNSFSKCGGSQRAVEKILDVCFG